MSYRNVFLIGAPRSGTTWLQRMLGAHPAVATTQELDIFDGYVKAYDAVWSAHLRHGAEQRYKGLPTVLTIEEYDSLLQQQLSRVYGKVASLKSGISVVLDKNPAYSLHVERIRTLLPDARFLHIVRDGRDVSASLVAAGQGWGRSWAPKSIEYAGNRWARHVRAARRVDNGDGRYLEIRYEELSDDGPPVLRRCLELCGVETDDTECKEIYAAFAFSRKRGDDQPVASDSLLWSGEVRRSLAGPPSEPGGFYREGRVGAWRQDWSGYDRWSFDRSAGDLLVELGYAADRNWTGTTDAAVPLFRAARAGRAGWRRVRRLVPGR